MAKKSKKKFIPFRLQKKGDDKTETPMKKGAKAAVKKAKSKLKK